MPNKSPHELTPGLVLADDVFNLDAKLLFPAGTALKEKQIEILMMWGTEHVSVNGSPELEETISIKNFSKTIKLSAEEKIKKRFKLVKSSHPFVIAMREIAILELAKSSEHPVS